MTSFLTVEKIVVLGTGGTIAGLSENRSDNVGYKAAQVGVEQLLSGVTGLAVLLAGRQLVTEQVAQIDSKDMSFDVWRQLALRVNFYLNEADVKGIVITHGTDTLEETAYFLHAVLPAGLLAHKPVVLTCAMRPASSTAPDGPQNLLDAVTVAMTPDAQGVVVLCAGTLHGAVEVHKVHPYRLDAFSSGDTGPIGYVEEGALRLVRNWPLGPVDSAQAAINNAANKLNWPRVEIVMNYAGATGATVDALTSASINESLDALPVRGLVVATTGNGTMHHDLEAALHRAQNSGVKVVLASRCCLGRVLPKTDSTFPDSQGLSPVKARVALMLSLLA